MSGSKAGRVVDLQKGISTVVWNQVDRRPAVPGNEEQVGWYCVDFELSLLTHTDQSRWANRDTGRPVQVLKRHQSAGGGGPLFVSSCFLF